MPQTNVDSHSLVETLHDEAGAALRSVSIYDETSYEMLYLRENVEAIYSKAEIEEIFQDLRLEGWGRESLEERFNAGSLECSVYGFEEAMMFHFVTDGFGGALVTFDRGQGIETEAFMQACKNEL